MGMVYVRIVLENATKRSKTSPLTPNLTAYGIYLGRHRDPGIAFTVLGKTHIEIDGSSLLRQLNHRLGSSLATPIQNPLMIDREFSNKKTPTDSPWGSVIEHTFREKNKKSPMLRKFDKLNSFIHACMQSINRYDMNRLLYSRFCLCAIV